MIQGYTHHVGLDGYGFDLRPGDHRYRAPLSKTQALFEACFRLGIPYLNGKDYAERCGFKFDEPEESP